MISFKDYFARTVLREEKFDTGVKLEVGQIVTIPLNDADTGDIQPMEFAVVKVDVQLDNSPRDNTVVLNAMDRYALADDWFETADPHSNWTVEPDDGSETKLIQLNDYPTKLSTGLPDTTKDTDVVNAPAPEDAPEDGSNGSRHQQSGGNKPWYDDPEAMAAAKEQGTGAMLGTRAYMSKLVGDDETMGAQSVLGGMLARKASGWMQHKLAPGAVRPPGGRSAPAGAKMATGHSRAAINQPLEIDPATGERKRFTPGPQKPSY